MIIQILTLLYINKLIQSNNMEKISRNEAIKIINSNKNEFSSINDYNQLIDLLIDNKLKAKNAKTQEEIISLKKEELKICSRIAYIETLKMS